MKAEEVKKKILAAKGNYVAVKYRSQVVPAAAYKGKKMEKIVKIVCRAGIEYRNLASVKNSEKTVGELPWGKWREGSRPYIIDHIDKKTGENVEYLRLYRGPQTPHVEYLIDGVTVGKEEFSRYLTPSAAAEKEAPECFTIKADNLLDLE